MGDQTRRYAIVNGIGEQVVGFRGPLVRALVARGHEVLVSTPRPAQIAAEEVERDIAALGARCVFSPIDRTGIHPWRERAARRHFEELFREFAPHGIFASNPKPVFHGIPASRTAGVPVRIAMITGLGHAFTARGWRAALLRTAATALYRRAMRDATAVFFQNPDDRAEFHARRLLPEGLPVHACGGSGVDLEAFAAVPPPDGPPIFLMVSRLLGDKGVREFVAAARNVRAQEPGARFRLVGWIDSNPSAITREELDGWLREGVVEYGGHLRDVRPELAACSVFVLPSYREGTPKSVLEAMAIGRPVVTTDAPGCRETVEHGRSGLLVRPRDAASLAEACLALARDPLRRQRMGEASRARAERLFDARAVTAAICGALGA